MENKTKQKHFLKTGMKGGGIKEAAKLQSMSKNIAIECC